MFIGEFVTSVTLATLSLKKNHFFFNFVLFYLTIS